MRSKLLNKTGADLPQGPKSYNSWGGNSTPELSENTIAIPSRDGVFIQDGKKKAILVADPRGLADKLIAASDKISGIGSGAKSSSKQAAWVDNRQLGREGKYQIEGNYTPKVGDNVDYYDLNGDKQEGTVLRVTKDMISLRDTKTKSRVKLQFHFA